MGPLWWEMCEVRPCLRDQPLISRWVRQMVCCPGSWALGPQAWGGRKAWPIPTSGPDAEASLGEWLPFASSLCSLTPVLSSL